MIGPEIDLKAFLSYESLLQVRRTLFGKNLNVLRTWSDIIGNRSRVRNHLLQLESLQDYVKIKTNRTHRDSYVTLISSLSVESVPLLLKMKSSFAVSSFEWQTDFPSQRHAVSLFLSRVFVFDSRNKPQSIPSFIRLVFLSPLFVKCLLMRLSYHWLMTDDDDDDFVKRESVGSEGVTKQNVSSIPKRNQRRLQTNKGYCWWCTACGIDGILGEMQWSGCNDDENDREQE